MASANSHLGLAKIHCSYMDISSSPVLFYLFFFPSFLLFCHILVISQQSVKCVYMLACTIYVCVCSNNHPIMSVCCAYLLTSHYNLNCGTICIIQVIITQYILYYLAQSICVCVSSLIPVIQIIHIIIQFHSLPLSLPTVYIRHLSHTTQDYVPPPASQLPYFTCLRADSSSFFQETNAVFMYHCQDPPHRHRNSHHLSYVQLCPASVDQNSTRTY